MATTVNNKRTFAKDIATISTALDGIVEFQSIEFSQILITEHGQSINDLQYVNKIRGIYFYTSLHYGIFIFQGSYLINRPAKRFGTLLDAT